MRTAAAYHREVAFCQLLRLLASRRFSSVRAVIDFLLSGWKIFCLDFWLVDRALHLGRPQTT